MNEPFEAKPWIPPPTPDLARLAWEAADAAGVVSLQDWPVVKQAGIAFGELPTFLCWHVFQGTHHLVLLQPRELGALVEGARPSPLPPDWLETLDLEALARPLACHPDFPGGASVHVVRVPTRGRMECRTFGHAAPGAVSAVVERLTGIREWMA